MSMSKQNPIHGPASDEPRVQVDKLDGLEVEVTIEEEPEPGTSIPAGDPDATVWARRLTAAIKVGYIQCSDDLVGWFANAMRVGAMGFKYERTVAQIDEAMRLTWRQVEAGSGWNTKEKATMQWVVENIRVRLGLGTLVTADNATAALPPVHYVTEWMVEQDIAHPTGYSQHLIDFLEDEHAIYLVRDHQGVIDGEVIDITSDGVGYGEFDRVVP